LWAGTIHPKDGPRTSLRSDAPVRSGAHHRDMIEIRSLTKRYSPTLAVDDLSFTVLPGHVTGFLGPNGAGKTTTMRVLLGLAAPTAGEALIAGRRYRELGRPLTEVGALLDANAVEAGRSALDHLRWLARSNRIADTRVRSLLEQVGLGGVARRPIRTFSLGMRQRLGVAVALLGDPAVLLFDEPVNGLDPDGVRWIRELFRSLAAEGRTVFVSSHLMTEMAITADRLVIIGRGRLIAETTVAELESRFADGVEARSARAPELAERLKRSGAGVTIDGADRLLVTGLDAAGVGRAATDAGIPLIELAQRHATLEEAYLELTSGDTDHPARSTRENNDD
jgi:ABC-2 type transport system ATP-binding protein